MENKINYSLHGLSNEDFSITFRRSLRLKQMLNSLTDNECLVITSYVLCDNTFEATGKILNITRQRARQIYIRACKKLKKEFVIIKNLLMEIGE